MQTQQCIARKTKGNLILSGRYLDGFYKRHVCWSSPLWRPTRAKETNKWCISNCNNNNSKRPWLDRPVLPDIPMATQSRCFSSPASACKLLGGHVTNNLSTSACNWKVIPPWLPLNYGKHTLVIPLPQPDPPFLFQRQYWFESHDCFHLLKGRIKAELLVNWMIRTLRT